MDSSSHLDEEEASPATSVLFDALLSDEEPSEDTFIVPEQNEKKILYAQGLYDPGSGEVCAKYVPWAPYRDGHPYLDFPAAKDPGIVNALLETTPEKVYPNDGQELYLHLCEELSLAPVRIFYKGLLEEGINLSHYCLNPKQIRIMCLALAHNKTVKRLDLSDNFLNYYDDDPAYHLGDMLASKDNVIQDLVLSGCRLGPRGTQRIVVHLDVRKMNVLDLSGNNMEDEGFQYLNEKLYGGGVIRRLNISNNNLTSETANLLAQTLSFNNNITQLDLSKNLFAMPRGVITLIRSLSDNMVLEHLNLAGTFLRISGELAPLFHIESLKVLNLSKNKLTTNAAQAIGRHLPFAVNLKTLDLSGNPFKPADALEIIQTLKLNTVHLQELFFDHIVVDHHFTDVLEKIMKMPQKRNVVVTHGEVLPNYSLIKEIPLEIIVLKRIAAVYHTEHSFDIMAYFLNLSKHHNVLNVEELINGMLQKGFIVDMETLEMLLIYFPASESAKNKKINFTLVAKYISEIWPNKRSMVHHVHYAKPHKKKSKGKTETGTDK